MKLAIAFGLAVAGIATWIATSHYVQARRPQVFVVLTGTQCLINHRPVACDEAVSYVTKKLRTPKWLGVAFAADESSSAEGARVKAAFVDAGYRVQTGLVKVGRMEKPVTGASDV